MGLWRRTARRWKALIVLFHLNIGFPGGGASSGGQNRAGARVRSIYTPLNSSLKYNAIYKDALPDVPPIIKMETDIEMGLFLSPMPSLKCVRWPKLRVVAQF